MEKPDWFSEHEATDQEQFGAIREDTKEMKIDIKVIKENHLAHMQVALEKNAVDTAWIKWMLMTSIGAIIVWALGHV